MGNQELRAGAFVLLGLLVLGGAIVLLGQKDSLFTKNAALYVSFDDISGLSVGAPVRLVGLDVGTVADIAFPKDLSKSRARVTLAVRQKYLPRVRGNSLAFIDSAGLLGDKVVNISMGDPEAPPLSDGDTLGTGKTLSFEALSQQIHEAIESVQGVTEGLNVMVDDLREDKVQDDIAGITRSLAAILKEVETGKGVAHRVVYDPSYAAKLGAILTEAHTTVASTSRAMGRVERILGEVERGDGTLHEVVYGEGGKRAIQQLETAAREIGEVVREVREGEGLAHTLVYDEGNTNFLKELNEMSATLNRLTTEIDQGRGTIGGLLKDPTIYEELKTLIGNVKRNVFFKTLVRFTIDHDELRKADQAPKVVPQVPSAEGAAVQTTVDEAPASP